VEGIEADAREQIRLLDCIMNWELWLTASLSESILSRIPQSNRLRNTPAESKRLS